MRFDHVGVLVRDLGAARRHAEEVLGLGEPSGEVDAPEHGLRGLFYDLGPARLELLRFDEPGDRLPEGVDVRIDHVCVEVADLDATAARLRGRGVRFAGPRLPDEVAEPVEMRGRRHLWTQPATAGGWVLQLVEATGAAAEVPPGRYRHYKGGEYELLDVARHSETEEELVVYRARYGERGTWVRPKAMFLETVEVDGRSVPRFARIAPG